MSNKAFKACLGVIVAASLAACGGSESGSTEARSGSASAEVSEATRLMNEVAAEVAATEAASANDSVVTPGTVAESDDTDDDSVDSYDGEEAKAYVATGGTSGRTTMVARDPASAPVPFTIYLGEASASSAENASKSLTLKNEGVAEEERRVLTGFGRAVGLGTSVKASAQGAKSGTASKASASAPNWAVQPDGSSVMAMAVDAGGAATLRASLAVTALPEAARVSFYAPEDTEMMEVSGEDINRLLAVKRRVDADAPGVNQFWGPTTEGSKTVVEIRLPAGVSTAGVDVGIDYVMQGMDDAKADLLAKAAGSCQRDAVCEIAGTGTDLGDSTVLLSYVVFGAYGEPYQATCTGTLVGDNAGTGVPYLLTANHCINSQALATELQASIFYRSNTCNSSGWDARRQLNIYAMGEFLYSSTKAKGTDSTLLRLNPWSPMPDTLPLAGWNASYISKNTAVELYHHPAGDKLKFSAGSARYSSSRFLKVYWHTGTTEPGSSGAALLNPSNQVVGTLWGGQSSCSAPNAPDFFGRFSHAYAKGMRTWLNINSQQLWAAADLDNDGKREFYFRASKPGALGYYAYQAAEIRSDSAVVDNWSVVNVDGDFQFSAPKVIAVLDFDGDGREDIVYRTQGTRDGDELYLLTKPAGSAEPHSIRIWRGLTKTNRVVTVGDLDADGTADLLIQNLADKKNMPLRQFYFKASNTVPRTFTVTNGSEMPYGKIGQSVLVGNFNSNPNMEALFKYGNYYVPTFRFIGLFFPVANNGKMVVKKANFPGLMIAQGDINGDGRTDFLFYVKGKIQFKTSVGDNYDLSRPVTVLSKLPTGAKFVALTDMDNDGKDDLVYRNFSTGQTWITRSVADPVFPLKLYPITMVQ